MFQHQTNRRCPCYGDCRGHSFNNSGACSFSFSLSVAVTYIRLGIKHVPDGCRRQKQGESQLHLPRLRKICAGTQNLPKKYNFKRSFAVRFYLSFTVFGILWGYAVVKGIRRRKRRTLSCVRRTLTFGLFFVSLYNMYRRTFFKKRFM